MSITSEYDHILIRNATILVRVPRGAKESDGEDLVEFYDVSTGVQLRQIYPELQAFELSRGYLLSEGHAAAILKSGAAILPGPSSDPSKVVPILELKQRKLDSVVADSILDQLRVITDLLRQFLEAADSAQREEKFWLSQQILTLVRKFSGRELAELEEMVDWFKKRPRK